MADQKSKTQVGLKELQGITVQGKRVADSLVSSGRKASEQTSSVLCGATGGAVATGLGYALSLTGLGVSFAVIGPILAAAGIFLGVLAYRGPRWIQLERQLNEQTLLAEYANGEANKAKDDILKYAKIQKSGTHVPDEIFAQLWAKVLYYQSGDALNPSKGRLGLPPPLDSNLGIGYSTHADTVESRIPAFKASVPRGAPPIQ